jgi:mono/diheme cytochrome c family protein
MRITALLLIVLALPALQLSVSGNQNQTARNSVPSSPESIASGSKTFGRYCATCHGVTGQGDGAGGTKLSPKPSNLTDGDRKHGSSDSEVFAVIHDGVKNTGMKGYASRLTEHEIWDLVNYIRSISAK